jgi:hypothetical protein
MAQGVPLRLPSLDPDYLTPAETRWPLARPSPRPELVHRSQSKQGGVECGHRFDHCRRNTATFPEDEYPTNKGEAAVMEHKWDPDAMRWIPKEQPFSRPSRGR